MANKQLTNLNVNHLGKPYYCLAYAYTFLGAKPKYGCAYDSWQYNRDKNYGYDYPKDVAVPLYFSWYGTIDGEYKNWGHCAVSYNNKIYSSPRSIHKNYGREIFKTIAEVEKAYGAKYLGYSSMINDIKVYEIVKSNDIKYIVKKGDTLSAIASKYNMNYKDLARYNNISNPDKIFPDQVIYIQTSNNDHNEQIKYTVKNGDTLSKVATIYNVNYMEIYNQNKILIDNENIKRGIDTGKMWIYPGQELIIKK